MTAGSWNFVQLGRYCEKIGSGATPRGGEAVYLDSGVALIRSQNVYNGRFLRDGLAYSDAKHADQLRSVTVMPRDVLLNITGDSVARSCKVADDILPARVNQHVAIIRTIADELLPEFLSYFLVSPQMQGMMLSLAGAGGTRKALTKEMIERFKVPLPMISVQNRIVSTLSAYDDQIENNRRRIALLEEAARLLYREWFVHLRFPGHEHVNITDGVPEDWERRTLGDLLTLKRGYDLPQQRRMHGEIPIVSSSGITGYHNEKKVDGPGIVTGRYGTIGKVYLIEEDFWPLNTALYVVNKKGSPPVYLLHTLRHALAQIQSEKAAVPGLNRNSLHAIRIMTPPSRLRFAFEEAVTLSFSQIRTLNIAIDKLSQARDLLLPRLMNGEMAV